MKRIYLIAIAFLLFSSPVISIEPNFLVVCVSSGDTAVKYSDSFETVMESYLNDAFPCAKITKRSGIVTRLARERLNQLLGGENQQELVNIGKDYELGLFRKIKSENFRG